MLTVGIDPGMKGVIAFVDRKANPVQFLDLSEFCQRNCDSVTYCLPPVDFSEVAGIAIEDPAAIRLGKGKGKATYAHHGSSKILWKSAAAIEQWLSTQIDLLPMLVPPQEWQRHFGLVKLTKEERKWVTFDKAMELSNHNPALFELVRPNMASPRFDFAEAYLMGVFARDQLKRNAVLNKIYGDD